ncbi:hypothetical protein B5M09_010633 [Aphanomyces astaci]|uniref:Uncharacterized protein n=1 Tax=Aphanomyces astaci TaxID=112090 RepID=A0A3R7YJE9_APHAT|nr:hypothetical protein B5M09_010633 [Aphanomyces astaci]
MRRSEKYTFAKVWKVLKAPPHAWKSKRPTRGDLSNDWIYYSCNVTLRGESNVVEWAKTNRVLDKTSPFWIDAEEEKRPPGTRDASTSDPEEEKRYVCVATGCDLDTSLATDPCSVCGKPVHHICSNDIAPDPEEASLRYCSVACYGGVGGPKPVNIPSQPAEVVDLTGDSPLPKTSMRSDATIWWENPQLYVKQEVLQTPKRTLSDLCLPPTPPDDYLEQLAAQNTPHAQDTSPTQSTLQAKTVPQETTAPQATTAPQGPIPNDGNMFSTNNASQTDSVSGNQAESGKPSKTRTYKEGSKMWEKQQGKKQREAEKEEAKKKRLAGRAEKEEAKKKRLEEKVVRDAAKEATQDAKKRRAAIRNSMPPTSLTNTTPDLQVSIRPETARVQLEPRGFPPKSMLRPSHAGKARVSHGTSFLQRLEQDSDASSSESKVRPPAKRAKTTANHDVEASDKDGDSDLRRSDDEHDSRPEEIDDGLDSGDEGHYDEEGNDVPFDDVYEDESTMPRLGNDMEEYDVDGTDVEDLSR